MQFSQWLDQELSQPGKTAAELARLLRLEPDKISKMRKGRRRPSAGELPIIERYVGSASPLKPRLVDSFNPDAPDPVTSDSAPDHDLLDAARRAATRQLRPGEIVERDVRGGMGSGSYAPPLMIEGQVVDNVRATWVFPTEFLHAELRAREGDVDIIPVDGDSMIPTLLPGDRVMIHRQATAPSPDGLFAIDDGIGTSVKRLQIVRGSDPLQVRIISDNPIHQTEILMASDLKVIGRVICKVTRL